MGEENVDVEFPDSQPHMLLARLLTTPAGKVIVIMSPFERADEVLTKKDAAPPAPTEVDIINPVSAGVKQPMHGLASNFTIKGVSFSKVFALARFLML